MVTSSRTNGQICVGGGACQATPGATPSAPRLLCICNRANHCYANSLVCSLNRAGQLLPAQVIWNQAMYAVMQRMCLKALSADLSDSLQWTLLHSSWRSPHTQHDVAEYLGFCRRFIIPDLLQGRWQNRLLVQDEGPAYCEVRDCGDAWPILLATPLASLAARVQGDVTIQRLIHVWQEQAVDGLTALEQLLV